MVSIKKYFSSLHILKFSCLVSASIMCAGYAHALPLDTFDYQTSSYLLTTGTPQNGFTTSESIQQTGDGAFGGTRSVELNNIGGKGSLVTMFQNEIVNTSGNVVPSQLFHGSGGDATGSTLLTYDGDDQLGLTSFDGFKLDLTEGGADSLVFDVSFDYYTPNPILLEFTFYDASDTTGNTFSQGTFSLAESIRTLETRSLSFASFSVFGSNGAADLTNIGAFTLKINGEGTPNGDFGISQFGTNGVRTEIPEPATLTLFGLGSAALLRRKRKLHN